MVIVDAGAAVSNSPQTAIWNRRGRDEEKQYFKNRKPGMEKLAPAMLGCGCNYVCIGGGRGSGVSSKVHADNLNDINFPAGPGHLYTRRYAR